MAIVVFASCTDPLRTHAAGWRMTSERRQCLRSQLWVGMPLQGGIPNGAGLHTIPYPVYRGGRCGNNSRPHAKITMGARNAPLPARPKSWQYCVGARIVATAPTWVHRGSVQLANTTRSSFSSTAFATAARERRPTSSSWETLSRCARVGGRST